MVTVGVLAALVNVVVLIVVAIGDRAIEHTVRWFAASRLRNRRRAPVVHDSDTWLPNIPRSMFKYRKSPAILLTLFCSILLVASELVSELGVEVSETCGPTESVGAVITPRDTSENVTDVEMAASALFLQRVDFFDGPLDFVAGGFPRQVNESICLHCVKERATAQKEKFPFVLENCKVFPGETFREGELLVGVQTTNLAFGTITVGFNETQHPFRSFHGLGDSTRNGKHCASFIVSAKYLVENRTLTASYLEYADNIHCGRLIDQARDKQKLEDPVVWNKIKTAVRVQTLQCDSTVVKPQTFETALRVYRAMQLENTIRLKRYLVNESRFEPFNEDDIYRAMLAMKVIDDDNIQGSYFAYHQCGHYKVRFMVPFLICTLLIVVLGVVSFFLRGNTEELNIPYNSNSWYQEARRARSEILKETGTRRRRRYLQFVHDELVLVDSGGRDQVCIDFHDFQEDDGIYSDIGAGPSSSLGQVDDMGDEDVLGIRRPNRAYIGLSHSHYVHESYDRQAGR